jgi:hypothetical protein
MEDPHLAPWFADVLIDARKALIDLLVEVTDSFVESNDPFVDLGEVIEALLGSFLGGHQKLHRRATLRLQGSSGGSPAGDARRTGARGVR